MTQWLPNISIMATKVHNNWIKLVNTEIVHLELPVNCQSYKCWLGLLCSATLLYNISLRSTTAKLALFSMCNKFFTMSTIAVLACLRCSTVLIMKAFKWCQTIPAGFVSVFHELGQEGTFSTIAVLWFGAWVQSLIRLHIKSCPEYKGS